MRRHYKIDVECSSKAFHFLLLLLLESLCHWRTQLDAMKLCIKTVAEICVTCRISYMFVRMHSKL